MRIQAVSMDNYRTPPPVSAIKASHTGTGLGGTGFRGSLEDALGSTSAYVVRRGDTLSHIVARQLRASGQRVTNAAIYEGVARVASANGIHNPDLILIGQKVNLDVLAAAVQSTEPRASSTASLAHARHHAPPSSRTGRGARPVTPASRTTMPPRERTETPALAALKPLAESLPRPRASLTPRATAESPWQRVLDGRARLTSEFGTREDPISGHSRYHYGIDLAAARGTPITPLAAGRVLYSGRQQGFGNVVVVRHSNGLQTLYAHNTANLVSTGDTVSPDTAIASVGTTGRSTGPHLHFEIRRYGRTVDPIPFLTDKSLNIAGAR